MITVYLLQFDISGLIDVGDAYDLMRRHDMGKPYFEEAVEVLQAFSDDSSLPKLYGYGVGKTNLIF